MPPKGKKKKFVKVISSNKQIESVGNNILNELVSEDQLKDALNKSRLDTSQLEDGDDQQNQSMDSNGMLTTLIANKFAKKKNNFLNMSHRSDLRDSNLEEDQSNISIHDDQNDLKSGTIFGDFGLGGEDSKLDTSENQGATVNKVQVGKHKKERDAHNLSQSTPERQLENDLKNKKLNFTGIQYEDADKEVKTHYQTERVQIKQLEEEEEQYYFQMQQVTEYLENEHMICEDIASRYTNQLENLKNYNEQIIMLEELIELLNSERPIKDEVLKGLSEEDEAMVSRELEYFKELRQKMKSSINQQVKVILQRIQKRKHSALEKSLLMAQTVFNGMLQLEALQEISKRSEEVLQQRLKDEEERNREKEEMMKKKCSQPKEDDQNDESDNQEGIIKQIEELVEDNNEEKKIKHEDAVLFSERNEHLKTEENNDESNSQKGTFRSNATQEQVIEGNIDNHDTQKNNSKEINEQEFSIEAFIDKQVKEKKPRNRLETVKEVFEEDMQSEVRHNSEYYADLMKQHTLEDKIEVKDQEEVKQQQKKDEGGSVMPIVVLGVGVLAAAAFAGYKFMMLK